MYLVTLHYWTSEERKESIFEPMNILEAEESHDIFLLLSQQVTESHADPETMLLSFLREKRILQISFKSTFTNIVLHFNFMLMWAPPNFLDGDFSEVNWNQVWLRRRRLRRVHGHGFVLPTCHQKHRVSFMINHMVRTPPKGLQDD